MAGAGVATPSTQLERMAGELRCPICLSLYTQAASLSCNHSFCTSCIMQSMKRISCCPVCKVPSTPREVRAAPQMDSLVAIFKGIESSAGISLFHSQPSQQHIFGGQQHVQEEANVPPPTKTKGRKKKGRIPNKDTQKPNVNTGPSGKKRGRRSKAALSRSDDNHEKASDHSVHECIPEEDRLHHHQRRDDVGKEPQQQVTNDGMCPDTNGASSSRKPAAAIPEPERSGEINLQDRPTYGSRIQLGPALGLEGEVREGIGREASQSGDPPSGNPQHRRRSSTSFPELATFTEEPPLLAPFFWVPDEVLPSQDELPTQTQTQTQTQAAARPLRPTFSDLKSSDDDEQFVDVQRQGKNADNELLDADGFDSDTFEWTQRPCSPELSSSPLKRSDMPFQFQSGILNDEEDVIGMDENEGNVVNGGEPGSPYRCIAGPPAAVEATETSQLQQEPATNSTGTLLKCRKLKKHPGSKSCSRGRKSLQSSDPLSSPSSKGRKSKLPKTMTVERISKRRKRDVAADSNGKPRVAPRRGRGLKKASNKTDAERNNFADHGLPADFHGSGDRTELQSHTVGIEQRIFDRESTHEPVHSGLDNFSNDGVPEDSHRSGDRTELQSHTVGIEQRTLDGESTHEPLNSGPDCVFCGVTGDSEVAGPIIEYQEAFPWQGIKAVHVHKLCAEWAPDVYFDENKPKNLACEITRGKRIKCSICGRRGAALGCCNKRCRRSFHYACGRATPGCKWDEDAFVMFCPHHAGCQFPKRKRCSAMPDGDAYLTTESGADVSKKEAIQAASARSLPQRWPPGPACKWVLSGSGLDSATKGELASFARRTGASLAKRWSPFVTHVIAGTDDQGAAKRTLKFLMAMMGGKWIVTIDWMRACLEAGNIVGEDPYEVNRDVNGFLGGPQRSRALAAAKEPKLLESLSFYFCGEFTSVSKEDLQSLIIAGRGMVLHRKPLPPEKPLSKSSKRRTKIPQAGQTIVLYDAGAEGSSETLREARSVASHAGGHCLPHSWLLDSVATCTLQPPEI